jgi:hypothetical protein
MKKEEVQRRFREMDELLERRSLAEFAVFERDGRPLHLLLTERFRKRAKRARCWASSRMLTAIGNAAYGFDPERPRSRGGADGVFLVDRDHRPPNEMMKKLFAGFLDRPGGEAASLAKELGTDVASLFPVRLVSHHMRLLGVRRSPGRAGSGALRFRIG